MRRGRSNPGGSVFGSGKGRREVRRCTVPLIVQNVGIKSHAHWGKTTSTGRVKTPPGHVAQT